jgi:ATP-dependent Clp protease adaptor protein ClpS
MSTSDDLVIEKKKSTSKKLKLPSKYKVVIHNDDVTTVEFVMALLIAVFNHDHQNAANITQHVHDNGSGIAGIYPFEIAEQKMCEGVDLARVNNYPLVLKLVKE